MPNCSSPPCSLPVALFTRGPGCPSAFRHSPEVAKGEPPALVSTTIWWSVVGLQSAGDTTGDPHLSPLRHLLACTQAPLRMPPFSPAPWLTLHVDLNPSGDPLHAHCSWLFSHSHCPSLCSG